MSNGKITLKKLSSLICWLLIGTNFQHSYVLDEFGSWKQVDDIKMNNFLKPYYLSHKPNLLFYSCFYLVV